jgi:ATP-dependent DNA helicase DinG
VGLEESEVTTGFLPTPFNMEEQARLVVPAPDNRKLPAPTEPGFDAMVVQMLRRAIRLARGRTMALFTSKRRLRFVADSLGDVGYRVLVQGQMERGALLAEFQRDVSSVLLATGSFWAGVDVPGEALSCLVIDKLPFEHGDPLSAAIKAQMQREHLNYFQQWIIPRAILTLKQGLGRLIRTTEDRGVMMILDSRLTQKPYGAQFLRSLDLPASCIVYRSEVIAEFLGSGLPTEPAGD